MLKGSARLFIGTRFVADTASNAKRANPAWTPSEGVSTAARLQLRCLSWVKNGSVRARAARPFYPQEQTSSACPGMSVWCQQPTLFDQFKNARIAAAVPFHQAFQQTVGLHAHPLHVAL